MALAHESMMKKSAVENRVCEVFKKIKYVNMLSDNDKLSDNIMLSDNSYQITLCYQITCYQTT
jgi:hypothetical protein